MKSPSSKRPAGRFIVLDGPDGSGKSTHLAMLAESLTAAGKPVLCLRDPGGTQIGEAIRQILLSPVHDQMTPQTELLLYSAARMQLWLEKIVPALESRTWVLCDRWIYSTCAYQGAAGKLGYELVETLSRSLGLGWADKAVILDIDAADALARLSGSPDRMESKSLQFHRAVRRGYLDLAKVRPEISIVDASGTVEQTQQAIRQSLAIS